MNLEKLPNNLQPINLPGCYSVNSVFWSAESKVCGDCAMQQACCAGRSDSHLDSVTHDALCASLPIKAGRVLNTLFKSDKAHAIRIQLKQRENALANKTPKFLRVALDELITGGFSKGSLRTALVQRLNCTDKTAFGWVSITVPVLNALDVLNETHGHYRIKI